MYPNCTSGQTVNNEEYNSRVFTVSVVSKKLLLDTYGEVEKLRSCQAGSAVLEPAFSRSISAVASERSSTDSDSEQA